MKQSVNQVVDFFKNHKYGRLSLILLILGLVVLSAIFIRSLMEEKPIALSKVAAAISAGRVVRIEELQGSATMVIYYKDGSQDTTRRDVSASFLEQMQFLGVSRSQMAKLEYEIVASNSTTNDKVFNTVISLAMLGMMGFALTRLSGGMIGRKKYAEGAIPNVTFKDVAGMDESREELVDIVTFLKDNQLTSDGCAHAAWRAFGGRPWNRQNFAGKGNCRGSRRAILQYLRFRVCGSICGCGRWPRTLAI
jgi:ATP-dependent Zn protease